MTSDTSSAAPSVESLRQQLASLAHEQWSGWMNYLFSRCETLTTGTVVIPDVWVTRWDRQRSTPYSELRADEQESDLQEADRVLAVLSDVLDHERSLVAEIQRLKEELQSRGAVGVPQESAPTGSTASHIELASAMANITRAQWIAAHIEHGTVTKRERFDECSCGGTFWRK